MEIEEIKKEILLKIMSGKGLTNEYLSTLPKDKDLRSFMCSLGSWYALKYALCVDKSSSEETCKAAYGNPRCAFWYRHYFGEQFNEND